MKFILTVIFSFLFLVSGFSQTRNVIVGTNDVIVQPTNFWSANASNGRTGLGLGSASTNSASAFQPSSAVLSNLASSNGALLTNISVTNVVGALSTNGSAAGLTNITAANITGSIAINNGGTGATNIAGARINLGLDWSALTNTNAATSLLGFTTNGTVVANTGTNVLTFTNSVSLSSVAGSDGILVWNPTDNEFYTAATFNGEIAFNNTTNAAATRTNLGLGWSSLTNTNAATSLLGFTTNGQVVANTGTNVLTFTNTVYFERGDVQTYVSGFQGYGVKLNLEERKIEDSQLTNYPVLNWDGGEVAVLGLPLSFNTTTNAAATRTNLGFSTNLNTLWTATNASNARSAVGLDATNTPTFRRLVVDPNASGALGVQYGNNDSGIYNGATYNVLSLRVGGINALTADTNGVTFANSATTRTNLGLGWSALTNTNTSGFNVSLYGSNTNPVLVDSNGSVVSPTNFWQLAPIQTIVQNFTPVVNSTNAATNSRTLYVYSLAISTTGVTNVVTLPTNISTFNGDEVTIIHMGPTSSVTAIRQLGSTNNLITINKTDESVKFIYENNVWTNFHNISFVEPIQFSGTNATTSIAASRTNLGIGWNVFTNTDTTNFHAAIFFTNSAPTNSANVNSIGFNTAVAWMEMHIITNDVTNSFRIPLFK